MSTKRQIFTRNYRQAVWMNAVVGVLSLIGVAYGAVHRVTGFGSALPEGLFTFCAFMAAFTLVFFLFARVIRRVVFSYMSDGEAAEPLGRP